ncbi:MAG TPA: monovalent cation/H(+) antiporter subunit G [Phycisphaerae bacterium]|nr:monovalent cation/H(+) antiporter subunit G [Phycisphaerae bacterium]
MNETVAQWIIGVGLAFDLLGCIGLVRLPDVYNRLQAATKCVTLGTCMILVGTLVYAGGGAMGASALICAVFLLLTSPVAAHAIARGAYRSGVRLWEGSVVDRFGEDLGAARPSAERAEPLDDREPVAGPMESKP